MNKWKQTKTQIHFYGHFTKVAKKRKKPRKISSNVRTVSFTNLMHTTENYFCIYSDVFKSLLYLFKQHRNIDIILRSLLQNSPNVRFESVFGFDVMMADFDEYINQFYPITHSAPKHSTENRFTTIHHPF